MFMKLALRNVKRQIGNDFIYFFTICISIALMFSVNNLIYSKQLVEHVSDYQTIRDALYLVTLFVCVVIALVLGYATSFLLRLRKKEFGMYLTMGMTRKNILFLFLSETFLLCIAALIIGALLGFFFYQGLLFFVSYLLKISYSFSLFSAKGFFLTIVVTGILFLLSSAASAIYLRITSIAKLIKGEKVTEKNVRHPVLFAVIAAIALIGLIASRIGFSVSLEQMYQTDLNHPTATGMVVCICTAILSILFFYIGISKSVMYLLLQSKRIRLKGTAVFLLRQLSGQLSSNAMMAGVLACLMSCTFIGIQFCLFKQADIESYLKSNYPFDLCVEADAQYDVLWDDSGEVIVSQDSEFQIDYAEIKSTIQQYTSITEQFSFTLYILNSDVNNLFAEDTRTYYFLSVRDFNKIQNALGQEPVSLTNEFLILTNERYQTKETLESTHMIASAPLTLNGKIYTCADSVEVPNIGKVNDFILVVPEQAMKQMRPQVQTVCYTLSDQKFNGKELYYSLFDLMVENEWSAGFSVRQYVFELETTSNALMMISILYISIVFLLMSMALLALKALSSLTDDKRSYQILNRMGVCSRAQSKTLFKQLFFFFLLPYVIPVLLTIPAIQIIKQLSILDGISISTISLYQMAGFILLILSLIYLLYFTATYFIAKRNVIYSHD